MAETEAGDLRAFLRDLVLRAADEGLDSAGERQVSSKGPVELVTDVDLRLEAILVDALRQSFPDWAVFSEEGRARDELRGKSCWFVDPLDGTTNFVHGHPFWAISIGGWSQEGAQVAIVYAPMLDELYLAVRGEGATVESPQRKVPPRRLRLRDCERLQDALLATGFPYRRDAICRLNLRCAAEALARAQGLRRGGSAALDLCHLAAGRLDGFWEATLRPWDVAAGSLIAAEAGAIISDYRGGEDYLFGERIVAAGPAVHAELLAMLRQAHDHPEEWPLGQPFEGPVPLTPLGGVEPR